MSSSIDQRIVEMQFDNKEFESGIRTSLKSIRNLENGLKLEDGAKGFENIGRAANNVSFDTLGSGVVAIQQKFTAMEVVAITALQNIVNKAMAAGEHLVKSLSIDQISAGFEKFGSKTSSVATLEAQGYALEDVNRELNRLNTFTDETSYNFTDMVANIAKFTATGKNLTESVTAMEGIANWAALSGQNAQTASRAMYQLSQAMGAGVMRLEDYKSIQNASMDTDEFRRKCIAAAISLGTLKDNGDETYSAVSQGAKATAFNVSQFTTQLTDGAWLTSDVMMKVFNDYSKAVTEIVDASNKRSMTVSEIIEEIHSKSEKESISIDEAIKSLGYTFDEFSLKAFEAAQKARTFGDAIESVKDAVSTGWMKTFELIFGNADEATDLWTELANRMYDVFAGGAEIRNEILESWKDAGGRTDLIDSIWNIWDAVESVVIPIKEAFDNIFPPMTAERLVNITSALESFTSKMKIGDETADKLKRTFSGIFSVFSIFKKILGTVGDAVAKLLGASGLKDLGNMLLDITAKIGDFLTSLNENLDLSSFESFLSSITTVISNFVSSLTGSSSFSGVLGDIGSIIGSLASKIGEVVSQIISWTKENVSLMGIGQTLGTIFGILVGKNIVDATNNLSGVTKSIKEFFSNLFDKKKESGLKSNISGIFDSLHDSLENFTTGIKASALLEIGILTASLKTISELDVGGIVKSVTTIGVLFKMLSMTLESITKTLKSNGSKGLVKAGASMVLMAESMKILADAMSKFGSLSLPELGKGLTGVAGGLTALCLGLKAINGVKVNLATSVAMLALAESCNILGDAMTKFAGLSWDEIAHGLVGMGGALAELVAAISVLGKFGGFSSLFGSAGIFVVVQSLEPLADALAKIGSMSWEEIQRGLVAMGVAIGELSVALIAVGTIAGFSSIFAAGALDLVILGLSPLADALMKFGSIPWEQSTQGIDAMGGALAELSVALIAVGKLAGFSGIFAAGSIDLVILGMKPLADALANFGSMSWEEIQRGLVAMGGALAEVSLFSGALGIIAGFSGLLGAGSILLTIQGLGDLADALAKFGSIPWEQGMQGLGFMGSALSEIAIITAADGLLAGIAGAIGSGSLLIAIQGLGDLADAFIKFSEIPWENAQTGLASMGAALSEIAGGGLLATFSGFGASAISEMAKPLGDLADSVKKWSDVTVPTGIAAQLGSLASGVNGFMFAGSGADAIATVAKPIGDLANSVKKWSDVVVPQDIGTQLGSLASGVNGFMFGGMGANAIATLAEPLGNLAISVKKWSGVTVSDTLGTQLSGLATGVTSFTFSGLGASVLNPVSEGLTSLVEAVKKWADVYIPENMSTDLQNLALGISSFGPDFLAGWSLSAVVGPLKELADSVKAWTDVSLPTNMQSNLESLAKGVEAFSFSAFGGWSISAIVAPLKDLAASISAWNNVSFSGNLGENLEKLAIGLESMAGVSFGYGYASTLDSVRSSISEFSSIDFASIASGFNLLNEAGTNLQVSLSSLLEIISGYANSFNSEGASLATALSDGMLLQSEVLTTTVTILLTNAVSTANQKYNDFLNAGSYLASALGAGISQNTSTVNAVNATIDMSLQSIQNRQGDFYSSGDGSATNVSNGFASKQGASVGTVENLITACVSKINAMRTDFLTAGTYAIGGFIEGFTSKIQSAAESAANLARSALNAAKSALDINSPSKEFAWLGEMSGEGYIQAMHKMVSKVSQSGTELGNTAVNSTTLALESLMDLVNNGIDTTPTIRPVIDLSDVESGVTALNSLMAAPRTLSLAGSINRVNAVSNSMDASRSDSASSNQNGGKTVEYGPMTINVYGAVGQDVNELANIVMEKVQHKVERTGAMWE